MARSVAHILEEAMALPVSERASVAYRLLSSLDGEPAADAQAVWRDELEKRARAAMSDDWHGDSWATVRERVKPAR
jgi:putative addiction module component (TIGR02574 family)